MRYLPEKTAKIIDMVGNYTRIGLPDETRKWSLSEPLKRRSAVNENGDFYHTLMITGFSGGDILVSAQSDDALNRALSSYNYASLRFLHVDGVRVNYDEDICFEGLIRGTSLDVI